MVTIDAAGCQRKIAQTIIDKKADYVCALKGNQGTLRDDVELFAQRRMTFKDTSISQDTTVRQQPRPHRDRTLFSTTSAGLQDSHQWPGLKSVVMVESERETNGKAETETHFYITSLTLLANAVGPDDPQSLDGRKRPPLGARRVPDDECRVRTDNAPFNLAIVEHLALNVLRTGKSKNSLRMRRKVAAWDDNALSLHHCMKRSVDSPRVDAQFGGAIQSDAE